MGWGGGGWTSLCPKIAGLQNGFCSLARPVLNRWLGGFEAESSMKGAHHTAWWDGDRGWQRYVVFWTPDAIPEVDISQWNDLKFHFWFQLVLAYCKCEAVSPVFFVNLGARSGRGTGTCRYWMILIFSRGFFFDDFDLIEIMQNPAIYYYSIHQLWIRAFTPKSCMSLFFLRKHCLRYLNICQINMQILEKIK